MNVLSLFDGISCACVALKRTGILIQNYYACEIDKYAIQVSKANHPQIVHLGSVVDLTPIPNLDLLIGGSPCQDLSIAKKDRKGLDGERSSLFWEYVRILKESNPKYFILENVASMPKDAKAKITEIMGVEPIMINASLVSAQSRKRLFWTNIPVTKLPEDRNIFVKDILLSGEHVIVTNQTQYKLGGDKTQTLLARDYKGFGNQAMSGVKVENNIRKLDPIECERLQGLPDNYTEGISNTQRYKCLGNAFNVDVICHILSFIK